MTGTGSKSDKSSIPGKERFFANRLGRIYLQALHEALQPSSYVTLLESCDLGSLLETKPPDNWERDFPFSTIACLDGGLMEQYGPQGGRRMARQTGQLFFNNGLRKLHLMASLDDLSRRKMPTTAKLSLGLGALARLFVQLSDQEVQLEDQGAHFQYRVTPCPICWGRQAEQPTCFFYSGLLQEATGWAAGDRGHRISQVDCQTMGAGYCTFLIDKEPMR